MAKGDSTEPMVRQDLTHEQLEQRSKMLAKLLGERDDIEEEKSGQVAKWNARVRLLDEQISKLGKEIREEAALIPSQLALGRDPDEEPPIPGAELLDDATIIGGRRKRGKAKRAKKAGKKRARANGAAATP